MIEIPSNSSFKIDVLVTKNDVSVGADYNPEYQIFDADTNELLESGTSTRDQNDVGLYYVFLTPSVTAIDRTLKVVWSYELDGQDISGAEYTAIATPYVEVGETVSELGLGSEPQDLNYFPQAKLRAAERLARMQINNYTGRIFAKRLGAQVVYGMGSDTLIFTERMTSFTKVEMIDEVMYDSENNINSFGYDLELTETGQGLRIKNSSSIDVSVYPTSAYGATPNLKFVNGARYKVYGTLGYEYVPVEVKQAALLLINDNLYNDSLWRQKYIAEFDTGQMSVKLRDSAFTGTGNLVADDLLDTYKITGIVVI